MHFENPQDSLATLISPMQSFTIRRMNCFCLPNTQWFVLDAVVPARSLLSFSIVQMGCTQLP
jgi:hypothetical protein